MPPSSGVQEGLISSWAGHLFALATPDGRVRTYDAVTGRLRGQLPSGAPAGAKGAPGGVPNGHLADPPRCLAWLGPQAKAGLAVSVAGGSITAYDTAAGSVRWQADGCHEGGAACLAFTSNSGLVSGGPDGQVCCIDPSSGDVKRRFRGSKHAVTSAAVAPDGSKLLLGGSTLALWDLEEETRIQKFAGHTMPVRSIAFAPSGRHALSAAASERSVAVWNTSGSKKARKLGGVAVATLPLEEPAVAVAACAAPGCSEDGAFYAAAVTEAGEVVVWLCVPEGEAALVGLPAARVRVGAAKAAAGSGGMGSSDSVLAAALEEADSGATLVVVRGNSAKPVFERVPIAAPSAAERSQQQQQEQEQQVIHLAPLVGGALLHGASHSKQPPTPPQGARQGAAGRAANGPFQDVEMLGPSNDGDLVLTRAAPGGGGGGAKKRGQPEADNDALMGSPSSESSDEESAPGGERTLGERVAALERAAAVDGGADGVDDADRAAASAAGAALLQGPVKADSLAVLLQQALRSGDKALLERCLGLSDPRVVRNSVRRLLPVDAAALLRACVERLQSRPVRGQHLAGWIRAVLLHHTAYLMGAPGVQPVMTSLYQTIEARLAMQRTLLSLAGRLDLLLAQTGAAGAGGGDDEDEATGARPAAVYEESGSEDGAAEVVVEDAFMPQAAGSDEDEDEDEDGSDDASSEGGSSSGGGSGSQDEGSDGLGMDESEDDDA